MQPKNIVPSSMVRVVFTLPRWMAFTASAMSSEDMSRMNVEKDVSSMLKTCVGMALPGGGLRR